MDEQRMSELGDRAVGVMVRIAWFFIVVGLFAGWFA